MGPTAVSMANNPPLLGYGAHSSEHGEQSSFAGVWSPTMRSMFPPLVGLGSPTIFEENVSSIARALNLFMMLNPYLDLSK